MYCTNRNSPKVQSTIDVNISDLSNIMDYHLLDFEYNTLGIFFTRIVFVLII